MPALDQHLAGVLLDRHRPLVDELVAEQRPQAHRVLLAELARLLRGGRVRRHAHRQHAEVGGDADAVDRVMPLLQAMGGIVVHQGGAGAGQHTKMCNQIVIATTMIGLCESLLYSHKAGLDAETMVSSIRGGAAGCWSLEHYAPRILQRDFDPGFTVDHFVKDMGIALREAERPEDVVRVLERHEGRTQPVATP